VDILASFVHKVVPAISEVFWQAFFVGFGIELVQQEDHL